MPRLDSFYRLCICASLLLTSPAVAQQSGQGVEFFEKRIRPVLVQKCYKCHSAKSEEIGGKLLLDTREGARKGGESGHAVVPKDLQNSLLMDAIQYKTFEMPPDEKLPDEVIADFRRWIEMGAPDPRVGNMPVKATEEQAGGKRLWSLQPVKVAPPPQVKEQQWTRAALDHFILAKLEQSQLAPVGDADPLALLRRVHFDLVGLPPPAERVDAFAANPSTEAFAEIVDQLLESPQFGERWGRHWLDVVRYAESNGKDRDVLMPHAWRYRDYVIDSLNADVPFDQFIAEQVAGDLMPFENVAQRDRLRIATGMLAIGSKSLTANLQMDLVDDQIDVVTRAVMGLTASCARCHDHKFDPIPTRDYYALAGIFRSTETLYGGGLRRPKNLVDRTKTLLVLGEDDQQRVKQVQAHTNELAQLDKQKKTIAKRIAALKKQLPKNWQARLKELQTAGEDGTDDDPFSENKVSVADKRVLTYGKVLAESKRIDERLKELKAQKAPKLELAVAVRDATKIEDCKIRIRGERSRLGDAVPRGYLSCFELPDVDRVDAKQSGRLQLAAWLTHPDNPFTARVAANRIWMHLLGRGLVESVDNFGTTGRPPTHPALLDHLAHRFVELDWSTKKLVREIVLSGTYQVSGAYHQQNYAADPENKLYWRMSRRRLEAEAIRDALLSASGKLALTRPRASAVARIGDGEWGRGINISPLSEPFAHRSVYLPIIRGKVPEVLKTFDYPEPSNVQGRRDVTNVPAQSLYLMNSPFVVEQAEHLAKSIINAENIDPRRIEMLYKICYGRYPQENEIARASDFLRRANEALADSVSTTDSQTLAAWTDLCHALFASIEFRYID
jgi:hypothetical protein